MGRKGSGHEGCPRRLDHRADDRLLAEGHLDGHFLHPPPGLREFGTRHRQRDHDLDLGVATGLPTLDHRFEQGSGLHPVQIRTDVGEPHPPGTDHRIGLSPVTGRFEQAETLVVELAQRLGDDQVLHVGQELVQRGVEEAHRDRQPVHGLEDPDEVLPLSLRQLLEGLGLGRLGLGQDHRPYDRQAIRCQEHVLGATQPDPHRSGLACDSCVPGGVGIRTHAQGVGGNLVGPLEQLPQLGRHLYLDDPCATERHGTRRAVNGNHVPLGDHHLTDREVVVADPELVGTHHTWQSPTTGHQGSVADEAAPCREDTLGHRHAGHVVGRGLESDEDDRLSPIGGIERNLRREAHPPDGRSRRGPHPPGQLDVLGTGG